MPSSTPPSFQIMKIRIFLLLLSPLWLFSSEVSNKSSGGKTVPESVKFKTSEEYDSEAAARIAGFTLPDDVKASLFADPGQTQNPSAICFDSKGNLYVAEIHRWRAGVQDIRNEQQILLDDINNETNEDRLEMYQRDTKRPVTFYTDYEDRIVLLRDSDSDGRADDSRVWAGGFNDILDGPGIGLVAGFDNDIYYTNIPHLWHLKDTDKDGEADTRTSLQDGFGVRMSISGHDMHGVLWGPDGRLYWSIGDRGFSFTTKEGRHYHHPYEGAVFRCEPDGSELEVVYTGLRNPQELAFDHFGNLFTCDNDADQWDKGRLVYLIEGGDSGWNHGHQVLLNFRNQLELRTPIYAHPGHKRIPMNPWMTESIWEPQHEGRPAHALPPVDIVSWGPSGMVYNYGATAMPERYDNHFWVCNFGGAKGDLEAFSVKPEGAGFTLNHHEVFMVGLGNTDVEFGPGGKMYLSCFNNNGWYKQDIGNIYTLASEEAGKREIVRDTEKLLTGDFAALSENELASLLGHVDMRVRLRSQFELASRGTALVLQKATKQKENRMKRIHGLWGLGQLARKDEGLLDGIQSFLSDDDPEIRAQAVRILGDSRYEPAGKALTDSLGDDSARVQSFAAIAVGKCGYPQALPVLIDLLAENNNKDVFLRHSIVQGLWGLNEREKMLKQLHHESSAVRLGVLLALRKLRDPRVKYFLSDEDPFVEAEAIRAINDLDLATALPALAEKLPEFSRTSSKPLSDQGHREWIQHTRIINANFRVGAPANASHLLTYASQKEVPSLLREQALLALLEWAEPKPVDSTNGAYRPLDPSKRSEISPVVIEKISDVFATAEGNLIGLATRLALKHGAEAPVELLTQQIQDSEAALEARVGSLRGLASQDPKALSTLWNSLLSDENEAFRAAAVETLIQIDPAKGSKEARKLAESDQLRLRQEGYRLLGTVADDEAIRLLRSRLETIENEKPGAVLDLLEAAAHTKDEALVRILAAREAALDPGDPLAKFRPALAGGDRDRGRELFMTHAAGQCAKCHKVNGDGGVAGPELTGIGSKKDAEYLLASLVDPSSYVVPGYGMMLITLKSGKSLGGTLMTEDEKQVTLKIPDPDDPNQLIEKEIPRAQIASSQPPVSAMPPMGYLMSATEIRDVVAYLASLKKKNGKKGH